jgi:ribosomal protein L24E
MSKVVRICRLCGDELPITRGWAVCDSKHTYYFCSEKCFQFYLDMRDPESRLYKIFSDLRVK